VSGAGMSGYLDLTEGVKGIPPKKFPYPIFNNLIPQIDVFLDDGYTKEEVKMINETRKILHDDDMKITATTVRVPVTYGHSESINVEFFEPCTLDGIKSALENQEGVILYDDITKGLYPMPCVCEDKDEVFVGRIRLDESVESGCNLFVVADNIRKGAATNAVQIAEYIIKNEK
jgi:aspartate-semialdehyde dehydrogenase